MAEVRLEDICKHFNEVVAVDNFNLSIKDKEFVVLVGPSGCGKTTTLRMIAGLEDITSGNIYIEDCLINHLPAKERNIAMVFQNYALYPHMSVRENMSFSLEMRKRPKDEIKKRVLEAAEILGIEDLLNRKPKQLSGGQRQALAVGRAIPWGGKIIIMDEPTAALGVEESAKVLDLVLQLKKQGASIIIISHNLVHVFDVADRIFVLRGGKRVGSKVKHETNGDEIVKMITGAAELL